MDAALIAVALAVGPQVARVEQELFASEATASSFLVSDWHKFKANHHPSYVLDGDPSTAWVEGKDGAGEGEWIRVETPRVQNARQLRLEIRNGLQTSARQFAAHPMPAEIDVVALGPGLEETALKRFTLEAKLGWQTVLLELPAERAFGGVELRVATTHPARASKDGCISDIRIFVDTDAKFENKKRATLLAWAKDRKQAARYFKKLPKDYPFASTHMRIATETSTVDDDVVEMTTPLGILASGTIEKPVRITKLSAVRAPEGSPHELELLTPFVDTSSFELLDTSKSARTTSHERADGTIAGLCFERESRATCVAFDESGKATALARTSDADVTVLRIERDENGKISGLDVQHVYKGVDGATSARRARYSTL